MLIIVCCRDVHAVCLWDDKGPAKIHQALKEDILDFIKQAQNVSGTVGYRGRVSVMVEIPFEVGMCHSSHTHTHTPFQYSDNSCRQEADP